ncbi:MAG: hypothetical protein N2044_11915 [Cyclobacteriaceae bacterium]|nr:hypothetical protein [Cyclobacteriaceae bacterium]MCX7638541.1 hypothetical protein [Cyclobacteriaceae bacterium]MDW8332219.1 hypothetical protein [Cyclobacteriaceae bacterium]
MKCLLNKVKRATLVTGLLFLSTQVHAQYRLLLLKGDKQVYSFRETEYIRFKRTDREHFNAGFISGIYSDAFRVSEDTTLISQIHKIDLTGLPNSGFKTATMGKTLIAAGLIFFAGDAVNTTLVRDEKYTVHKGVMISCALLTATGLVMQFVNNNYFTVGRKKKVISVNW